MSDNRNERKQQDSKARKKFVLWMIGFAIIGAVGGGLIGYLKDLFLVENMSDIQFFRMIASVLSPALTYIIGSVSLVALIWLFYRGKQHERIVAKWDKENEKVMDQIEERVGNDIWLVSLLQIINLIVFGMEAYCMTNSTMTLPVFWVSLGIMVIYTVCSIFIQSKLVNLVKTMNPEKRGNALEFSFRTQWEGSCDEAEKSMIYQAAYAAFKAVNVVCTILVVMLSIFGVYFEIGLLPLVITGIIWVTLIMAYYMEVRKMSKTIAPKSDN